MADSFWVNMRNFVMWMIFYHKIADFYFMNLIMNSIHVVLVCANMETVENQEDLFRSVERHQETNDSLRLILRKKEIFLFNLNPL